MKFIRNWIVSLAIIATAGGALFTVAMPQTAFADDGTGCTSNFLGFPAWYNGLVENTGTKEKPVCVIMNPTDGKVGGLSSFIWLIALNVIQMALMLVGYISVGYVLYGGFLLMTSRGKSDEIAEGQVTIRNAVVGLVISFGSVPIVNFISDNIKGTATNDFGVPIIDSNALAGNILGMVYMAAGIIAVITIIIAGYMYTISGGNPSEVEKSKNTILYAVIGLIVIAGAFTITQFVLGRF